MNRVVIVGAGGHAQVIADTIRSMKDAGADVQLLGFLDDAQSLVGQLFGAVPVLGPIELLSAIAHDSVVMGIGDNRTRRRIFLDLRSNGEHFLVARHPSSVIAPGVDVGSGTVIMGGVVVNTGSVIGENVILNTSCSVDHHNRVAAHSHLGPGVHTCGNVSIGEAALLGVSVSVLPGRSVGSWATVGAGGVVTRDVPEHATVAGVPARVICQTRSK